MDNLTFTLISLAGSLVAGFIGALSGIGGSMLIVPLLVLLLKVDFHYAIGAALLASVATSTGSAAAYLKEGYTNIRIATFLGTATVAGAILGAFLSLIAPTTFLYFLYAGMLLYSCFPFKKEPSVIPGKTSRLVKTFELSGEYPGRTGTMVPYQAKKVRAGFTTMFGAGLLSGLLGSGGGALNIVALDRLMGLPFKVSMATSNFMIGVTAAASAGIYFKWGYIDSSLVTPVVLGVLCGSIVGARIVHRVRTKILRIVLTIIFIISAIQMLIGGVEKWLA